VKTSTIIRLIVLSMIWGASFLFLRIATPEFRPLALILIRVAVGALCLAPVFLREESRATFRKYGWKIIVVGILNSAIPFSLLAYSTLSLEAGFTSLLNASTPIFAAVAGALWFGMRLGGSQVVGLCVALLGVVALSWDCLEFKDGGDGWAVLAALLASSCYGLAANLSRRWLAGVNVRVVSAGCMAASAVVLFPLGVLYWPSVAPSGAAWACALGLATACTAVAYLLYFRLLEDAGAVAASSVTFLVPIFGVLWGVWLLQERLDGRLLLGMVVTLLGAALTLKVIRLGFRTKRGDASESSK
jgi:drug/metabolite transporter (DMT)-like permease